MDWYKEGIPSAIALCREQRCLFIVYIKDDTEASTQTDQSWTSQEVLQVLSSNSHVGIELVKNSMECNQFSQLFPVLLTPCIFCIGLRGEQLVVRSGALDSSELTAALTEAFEKHNYGESAGTDKNNTKGSGAENQTKGPEAVNETKGSGAESNSKGSGVHSEDELDFTDEPTPEELKRIKERYRRQRKEKKTDEELEIARRKEGQKMEEWKKNKEDLEKENWLKERRKQKQEEQRARQEVLAKLEQDRQERAALKKQQMSNTSVMTSDDPPLSSNTEVTSKTPAAAAAASMSSNSKSARIQVKLPKNQTTILHLSSSDTVGTLRSQIAEYMAVEPHTISLTCVYPRKELNAELDSTPLSNHGLSPSGVVIARSTSIQTSSSYPSSDGSILSTVWGLIVGFFQFLLMILISIKNSVTSLFIGSNSTTASTNEQYTSSSPSSSTKKNKGNYSGGPRIRKFNQDDFKDDDDEKRKNTYNGNSTQQF